MSWAQCSPCGLMFADDYSFDEHRVGEHEYTFREGLDMDPPVEDGRRCLDLDEMERAGWKKDRFGRWVAPGKVPPSDPLLGRVHL